MLYNVIAMLTATLHYAELAVGCSDKSTFR